MSVVCAQAGDCVFRKNDWPHCEVEQDFGRRDFLRPPETPAETSGCADHAGA